MIATQDDWRNLLSEWEAFALPVLRDLKFRDDIEDLAVERGSLVFPPASESEISAAETKLSLNATLLHATFSNGCAVDASITYAPDAPECGSYIDGNYLPNSPSFSARGGIEQGFVDGAGGRWTARLEGKYQSSYYFSIFNHPDLEQRAYVIGDVSLGYAPADAKWQVEAYVHNFANEVVLANAQRNATVAANNYQFQAPRVAGMRVSAHF